MLVTGTLGILQQASIRGLVDLPEALNDLATRTNFYLSEGLIQKVLAEAEAMRPKGDVPLS